jgi:XTP/dITP diphosphohydrolase
VQIRFLSGNDYKIQEASTILGQVGFDVISVSKKIEEIQTDDSKKLIKDKTIKAFKEIGRPLFVEHTGLYLNYINGLPGGLTQIFWDNLQADKFCEIFGDKPDVSAVAKTIIGYIDGQRIHTFEGEISGKISASPLGNRDFQWDCIFMPDGYEKTFSELGEEKNQISMRRKALDEFASFLKENN